MNKKDAIKYLIDNMDENSKLKNVSVNNCLNKNIDEKILKCIKLLNYSLTANGTLYNNNIKGFMNDIIEKNYNDRKKYREIMNINKKRYQETGSEEDLNSISKYHNLQMAKKIQINAFYGAQANVFFRWFNFERAEAITTSGQLAIQWVAKDINIYFNKLLNTTEVDYIIASDTDSVYISLEKLISYINNDTDESKIINAIDIFCNKKILPFVDHSFKNLADYINAYDQKIEMGREIIANKGIWKAKKMYILNVWDKDGIRYKEPELKMMGIEAVRSSTPHICRAKIKESLKIIMNGTQEELQTFVRNFRKEYENLPFEDIAFPRGVNNIHDYKDAANIYKKSTPIHVRAALMFNIMIKKHNLNNISPIFNGDKIKFAYLKMPNPIHENVIGTIDILPSEFKLEKYIDRNLQFSKTFLEPLKSITNVIEWEPEQRATLEGLL